MLNFYLFSDSCQVTTICFDEGYFRLKCFSQTVLNFQNEEIKGAYVIWESRLSPWGNCLGGILASRPCRTRGADSTLLRLPVPAPRALPMSTCWLIPCGWKRASPCSSPFLSPTQGLVGHFTACKQVIPWTEQRPSQIFKQIDGILLLEAVGEVWWQCLSFSDLP